MFRVGVDLGGTNIVAAVVDDSYHIVSKISSRTRPGRDAESICGDIGADVAAAVRSAGLTPQEISGFGIGSCGMVNAAEGVLIRASNLDFTQVPLRQILYEKTGYWFQCENDANAAAWGEYIAGAGRGTNSFMELTLGTGIGGSLIVNGMIYEGAGYEGGEFGHTVIVQDGEPCPCGRRGCLEAYASASALIRDARRAMALRPDSRLWKLCGRDPAHMDAKMVFDARSAGDAAAEEVIQRYLVSLGTGIANFIRMLQPEVLCIGGGISNQGQPLIDEIEQIMAEREFNGNRDRITILRIAELGEDAGVIGAAFLHRSRNSNVSRF